MKAGLEGVDVGVIVTLREMAEEEAGLKVKFARCLGKWVMEVRDALGDKAEKSITWEYSNSYDLS